MEWRLFATLAEAAGGTTVTVDADGAETVGDALDALLEIYPDLESHVLDDDGDLYDHLRLLHEGENPFAEREGLETPIDPDDELAIFPPVSGG